MQLMIAEPSVGKLFQKTVYYFIFFSILALIFQRHFQKTATWQITIF